MAHAVGYRSCAAPAAKKLRQARFSQLTSNLVLDRIDIVLLLRQILPEWPSLTVGLLTLVAIILIAPSIPLQSHI